MGSDLYLIENITEEHKLYGLVHISDFIMRSGSRMSLIPLITMHWMLDPAINVYKIDESFIRAATDKDPDYEIIYDEAGNKYCLTKEIWSGDFFGNHKLNEGVEFIC